MGKQMMCNTSKLPSTITSTRSHHGTQSESLRKTSRPRRKVVFHEHVRVFVHIHVNNLSDRAISRTWYSQHELTAIKEELAEMVQIAAKIEIPNQDVFESSGGCLRGLESLTPRGAARRRKNKVLARTAVLEEQERQWAEDRIDADKLAAIYQACTKQTVADACLIAEYDEKAAFEQGAGFPGYSAIDDVPSTSQEHTQLFLPFGPSPCSRAA